MTKKLKVCTKKVSFKKMCQPTPLQPGCCEWFCDPKKANPKFFETTKEEI
jgi:hypothetical protein